MDEEFQDCSLNNEFGRKLETPHGERASPVPGVNKYEVAGGMAHGHWVSAREANGKDYCTAGLAALVAALGNIPSTVGPLPIVPAFIFPFPLYSL